MSITSIMYICCAVAYALAVVFTMHLVVTGIRMHVIYDDTPLDVSLRRLRDNARYLHWANVFNVVGAACFLVAISSARMAQGGSPERGQGVPPTCGHAENKEAWEVE